MKLPDRDLETAVDYIKFGFRFVTNQALDTYEGRLRPYLRQKARAQILKLLDPDTITVRDGKRQVSLTLIALLSPDLSVQMYNISRRAAGLYWSAVNRNWRVADYYRRGLEKQLKAAALSRHQHAEAITAFLNQDYALVAKAVREKDADAFKEAWRLMVDAVNRYHTKAGFGHLVYKSIPDRPADLVIDLPVTATPNT